MALAWLDSLTYASIGSADDGEVPGPAGSFSADPIHRTLGSVPSGEVVPGPTILATSEPPDPLAPQSPLAVKRYHGGFYARARARSWSDPNSDVGEGSFTLQLTDPLLSTAAEDELMVMYDRGLAVYPWLVRHIERKEVDQAEEAGQTAVISGPGLVDEWKGMLVYPDLGAENPSQLRPPNQETRVFNYAASTGVSDSLWPNAVATDPKYGRWDGRFSLPDGWPDKDAQWIWDRPTTGSVPPGNCIFRTVFEMPDGAERCQIWVAADDDFEFYLDGTKVLERDGYYSGQSANIEVDLGVRFHILAAEVHNRHGRGGLCASVLPVDTLGRLGTPIVRTDTAWQVLGYRPGPTFTVGRILNILRAEAQARGSLSGWELGFTDYADSNGNPWPQLTNYSIQVGIDGFSLLRQLAEAHIDFAVSPSGQRKLYAWRIGERGRARPATFTAGENLTDLQRVLEA